MGSMKRRHIRHRGKPCSIAPVLIGGAILALSAIACGGEGGGGATASPTDSPAPTAQVTATAAPTASPTSTPSPTPTQTPVPTPSPTPTPTPAPDGSSRAKAVAAGGTLIRPDGYEIRVLESNWDAWPLVLAENQFNDPPAEGNRMVLVRVRVSVGVEALDDDEDTIMVRDSDFSLVGSNNEVYTPFFNYCGVIPDELRGELFPPAGAEGNVCFEVPADETDFILIHEPFLEFFADRWYLELGSP